MKELKVTTIEVPNEVGSGFTPKMMFEYGTVVGEWTMNPTMDAYVILAIANSEPGNGDFKDFMGEIYKDCVEDGKHLEFNKIENTKFEEHLIKNYGFDPLSYDALRGRRVGIHYKNMENWLIDMPIDDEHRFKDNYSN